MKQHIQKHSIERRIDQTALRLLLKAVQIWEGPPKSPRKSSQRTVGGSKIDTNRGLLCHDELSSKNWKRMRVLRVTFQLEQMPGQFDLRSILIHKSIVLAMSIAMLWSFPHMSPYVSFHLRLCSIKGYLPNWFVYHHFPMKLAIGRYPPLTHPSNGSHRLSGWWF